MFDWLFSVPAKDGANGEYNYEHFTSSRYIFTLGGRLRTTWLDRPNLGKVKLPILPFTFIAVIFPIVLFAVFEAAWLWHRVSPAIPILFSYLWLVMFVQLLKAAFLDPGVLPRNIHLIDGLEKSGLPQEYHSWISLPGPNNCSVYAKYCTTCYTWRPVRTGHCSRCNVCVSNLDHHCPWIANCVGQRNFVNFFAFLLLLVINCAYLSATSFYMVVQTSADSQRVPLFLGIFSILASLYPVALVAGHVLLAATGITTREYLNVERHPGNSKVKDVCMLPFNSGRYCSNVLVQWTRPRGVSEFRLISRFQSGDRRFDTFTIGQV